MFTKCQKCSDFSRRVPLHTEDVLSDSSFPLKVMKLLPSFRYVAVIEDPGTNPSKKLPAQRPGATMLISTKGKMVKDVSPQLGVSQGISWIQWQDSAQAWNISSYHILVLHHKQPHLNMRL